MTDQTGRSRFAIYRDKKRGGPPAPLQPCGTYAAARRHQRRNETLCGPCKEAINAKQRERYQDRKTRA